MIKRAIIWIIDGLRDFWSLFTSTEVSYGYYIAFKNNVLENLDKTSVNNTIREIGEFSTYGFSGYKGCSPFKEEVVKSMLTTKLSLAMEDFEVSRSDNYYIFIR